MSTRHVTLLALLLAGGCFAPHYGVDAADAPVAGGGAAGSSHAGGSKASGGAQASGGTTEIAGQPDIGGTDANGGTSTMAAGQGGEPEAGAPQVLMCGPSQKQCSGKCVEISDVAYGCSPSSCNQSPCPADPNAVLGCDEPACIVKSCKSGYKLCGKRCVSIDDPKYGCGEATCDDTTCADPGGGTLICNAGKCVVGACSATDKKCGDKCVPKDEDNGCASASCDACAANETCVGNPTQCACVPNGDPCAGYNCGTATDSCGKQKTCPDQCTGTDAPICVNHACKQCATASDCEVPPNNPCYKAVCTSGTCGLAVATAGKKCSAGGTCSATEPGLCNRPPISVDGSYNIDATEVTNAQYGAFLKAKAGNMSGQSAACTWNTSYTPDAQWPGHPQYADYPVVHVDWCDAEAYCKWAGRRLCGKLGGGPAPKEVDHDGSLSEWVHACMPTPGASYPYGNTFNANACNTKSSSDWSAPVASYTGCVGGVSGLYDMIGNVAEWINSTHVQDGNDYGGTQGGWYGGLDDGLGMKCSGGGFYTRATMADFIGIRCCGP